MGKEEDDTGVAAEQIRTFPYHARTTEECFQQLGCSSNVMKEGLTSADAAARLQTFGPNKLSEKEKVTLCKRIYDQIANVLVGILIFVAVVSLARAVTSHTVDEIVSNWIQIALIVFVIV